jgi:hypothetical protein
MTGLGNLDTGVLTTDLLMGDELEARDRDSYRRYFRTLIEQRQIPLHTASLWNALHFGWSLSRGHYLGRGLQMKLADEGRPVPVGAMIEVPLGQRVLWAEVVYKEGRDQRIGPLGIVPPVASGARLGLLRARQDATVREALILDFDAFGSGVNEATQALFARAARRGWLTADRHFQLDVAYPAEDAGIDELTLFARHVFAQYGESLFNMFLRDEARDASREERWQFLLNSLNAIEQLALDSPDLITFGQYHFTRELFDHDRLNRDGVFGHDVIHEVAHAVAQPPQPSGRHFAGWQAASAPLYYSVSQLIREQFNRGGIDAAEADWLAGPSYSRMIFDANLALAELTARQPDGVYLRLDDEWQGGGCWRVVRCPDRLPPEARFDPLEQLGLGYASTVADEASAPAPSDEIEEIERTDRGWRLTLTLLDLDHGDLRLDPTAMEMLPANAERMVVELIDPLATSPDRQVGRIDRERRMIRDLAFSERWIPGIVLLCSLARGARQMAVRGTALAEPRELEGHTIRYQINERVFRRDCGFRPMSASELGAARSLSDQINQVFRRRGRPSAEGGRALRAEEVLAALLGVPFDPILATPILLRLQAGDFERSDGEYVWYPRISPRTSARERNRLQAAREANAPRLRRILKPRMVPAHIRQYTPESGRSASPHKIATYQWARQHYHIWASTPDELPPLATWVEEYPIGDEPEEL